MKKLILVFLLGALTFTPWNILLGYFEIISYRHPIFLGIAWWTPVAFGLLGAGTFLLFTIGDRLLHLKIQYNPNNLAYEYLLISGFYIAILFFRQYPYLLSLSLLFVVLLRLIFFHQPIDYVYFIFGACLGPTVELILTSLGLYLFTDPDFLGMPYWLPVFWGNVALALRRVTWILEPPKLPEPMFDVRFSGQ